MKEPWLFGLKKVHQSRTLKDLPLKTRAFLDKHLFFHTQATTINIKKIVF